MLVRDCTWGHTAWIMHYPKTLANLKLSVAFVAPPPCSVSLSAGKSSSSAPVVTSKCKYDFSQHWKYATARNYPLSNLNCNVPIHCPVKGCNGVFWVYNAQHHYTFSHHKQAPLPADLPKDLDCARLPRDDIDRQLGRAKTPGQIRKWYEASGLAIQNAQAHVVGARGDADLVEKSFDYCGPGKRIWLHIGGDDSNKPFFHEPINPAVYELWRKDKLLVNKDAGMDVEAHADPLYPGRDDAGGQATLSLIEWWEQVALTRPRDINRPRGTERKLLGAADSEKSLDATEAEGRRRIAVQHRVLAAKSARAAEILGNKHGRGAGSASADADDNDIDADADTDADADADADAAGVGRSASVRASRAAKSSTGMLLLMLLLLIGMMMMMMMRGSILSKSGGQGARISAKALFGEQVLMGREMREALAQLVVVLELLLGKRMGTRVRLGVSAIYLMMITMITMIKLVHWTYSLWNLGSCFGHYAGHSGPSPSYALESRNVCTSCFWP